MESWTDDISHIGERVHHCHCVAVPVRLFVMISLSHHSLDSTYLRPRIHISTLGIHQNMQGNYTSFQFPPLPTLDGHFLAQINAFCRESMIVSLVKTASELEIYAREFERSCGNLDQLLRPTFDMYRLNPPQLPVPVPLTAYPLDFRAPEGNCCFYS